MARRKLKTDDTDVASSSSNNSRNISDNRHPTTSSPSNQSTPHGAMVNSSLASAINNNTNYGATFSDTQSHHSQSSVKHQDQHSHLPSIAPSIGFDETGCIHYGDQPVCEHVECLSDEEIKRNDSRRLLIIVTSLCFFFMCVEIVGGYLSNSLAIMTDAAHLLSDLVAFMVSLVSISLAQKRPTSKMTFGYHRAEIIGALLSVAIIWFLTIIIVWEAIQRIITPQEVNGKLMFIVATIGAMVNLTMGSVLIFFGHGHSHSHGGSSHGHSHGGHGHSHGAGDDHDDDHDDDEDDSSSDEYEDIEHGHHHGHGHGEETPLVGTSGKKKNKKQKHWLDGIVKTDTINVRAAFLHVLGDLVFSIGVMIAALVVWINPTWRIADPLCTLFFSVIVIHTTFQITKQGISVLMEGTPEHLDVDAINKALSRINGVIAIHDLHVWSLTLDSPALSVHLVCQSPQQSHQVLVDASQMLKKKFELKQTTIQVEYLDEEGRFCTTWDAQPRICKRELSPGSHYGLDNHGGGVTAHDRILASGATSSSYHHGHHH